MGAGAVGAIYSWRLAKTCDVTTVCRSNYQAVKDNGFDIDSAKFGKEIFRPHQGKADAVSHPLFIYLMMD